MKTILVDALHGFVIKDQGVFQEMYALLESYPNPKIVLTGANDEQMKTFGLEDLPYRIFTLKHNPEKTDPQYFRIMLRELGLKSEEVVYFEHAMEAVESARSVGITTLYYDAEKKDLVELKAFLDENL